ncbi:TetR/AcrR family transcriptional regulator [Brevundimonas sp. Root1279]|uniref:TetR/AcrR family transcriptional regulator n=1 Tax=Brevundimonas sp. Root1279 TaxID=1736443 RepID=UPI0007022721|nr:TetR/AcrR family transcriptional regulator [Brevundimonas sp. Root1279]KQW86501.1 TetR family transcriptional regulator [Brevundimonas sp. Root1279]
MPRIAGQVDETKTEAILEAATALFHEKGATASMEEIARRAGVSRQTLYNRFPSKMEIGRALAARRSDAISAPLRTGGDPEAVLTALALGMLDKIIGKDGKGSMRGVAMLSPHAPDVAAAIYEAGPAESLRRLAAWLAVQDRDGRLSVPDPAAAAEMFAGMVLGHGHLRAILGVAHPSFDPEARARETARRFLRAFAG